MNILITGGTGYIGSHTCVELLRAGHSIAIVDDLSNSEAFVTERLAQISGQTIDFIKADIRDRDLMREVFRTRKIDAVIHFAGLKSVGESVSQPLHYYDVNVYGTIVLLQTMAEFGVERLIFSSSATVYGDPESVPIDEEAPLRTTNPYGASKLMIENILRDQCRAMPSWSVVLLRYFNPVGAHESGLIGENPRGTPNNLVPYIAQVAEGRREQLTVYGNDYPTPDGTGMRDYIHVIDLAIGHVKAVEKLASSRGVLTYNLGTGVASSVLEMLRAFEQACGKTIPYKIHSRRPGDIAICYAATGRAERELDWKAERNIEQMCIDAWRYQANVSA